MTKKTKWLVGVMAVVIVAGVSVFAASSTGLLKGQLKTIKGSCSYEAGALMYDSGEAASRTTPYVHFGDLTKALTGKNGVSFNGCKVYIIMNKGFSGEAVASVDFVGSDLEYNADINKITFAKGYDPQSAVTLGPDGHAFINVNFSEASIGFQYDSYRIWVR